MKNNNKLKKYIKMAIILIGGCALAAYFALKTPAPMTKKDIIKANSSALGK